MVEEPELQQVIEEELKRKKNATSDDNNDNHSSLNEVKIYIDSHGSIHFRDYPEVKIVSYQAQALYIFYLLVPDGVSNSELIRFEETLMRIYKEICTFKMGDDYRADGVIKGMLTRQGGISDATNKIRTAIKEQIKEPTEFERYVIQGARKGKRFILLPKSAIVIENSLLLSIKKEFEELVKENNN